MTGHEASPGEPVLPDAALELLRSVARRVEVARRLEADAGDALLRSIVETTSAIFASEAASIALYDAASDELEFRVAAGEQGAGVVGLRVPSGQGLAGYAFSTGQALAVADVASDARFGRTVAEQTAYLPRSVLAVPLVDDDGTIGVLEVLDKRDGTAFSMTDVERAGAFARQATVAIRATRLLADTRRLLSEALRGLAEEGARVDTADIEAIVGAAATALDLGDDGRLWALADQVARLRRSDPGKVELVTEILAALGRQADRASAEESRFRR